MKKSVLTLSIVTSLVLGSCGSSNSDKEACCKDTTVSAVVTDTVPAVVVDSAKSVEVSTVDSTAK